MSQGCKHLSAFEAAHLGMFFSFGAKRSAARKLTSLSAEKGPSRSSKDLCLAHHRFYLVG